MAVELISRLLIDADCRCFDAPALSAAKLAGTSLVVAMTVG
jgi:hypothetical protein